MFIKWYNEIFVKLVYKHANLSEDDEIISDMVPKAENNDESQGRRNKAFL